jgi:hypothetical protein
MVAVLDADPELGADLDSAARSSACREALAPLLTLSRGRWSWDALARDTRGHLGLLVLDGLLSRRETIEDLGYTELLGAGDVLRPWTTPLHATLLTFEQWDVLVPTRVAVLNRDFALRAQPWPEIAATLLDRTVMRSRSLGVTLAIHRAVRVEERLKLMLWHLADRWGHVTPDGTVLPLPLTHESLGRLIGARRSPVTVAAGNLQREGALRRGPGGSWILSPPSAPTAGPGSIVHNGARSFAQGNCASTPARGPRATPAAAPAPPGTGRARGRGPAG